MIITITFDSENTKDESNMKKMFAAAEAFSALRAISDALKLHVPMTHHQFMLIMHQHGIDNIYNF